MLKKRIASLVLAIIITASFVGCNKKIDSNNTGSSEPQIGSDKKSFQEFTDEIFIKSMEESVINTNYMFKDPEKYGIKNAEVTLGDFSLKASQDSAEEFKGYLAELKTYDRSKLTDKEKISYDIMLEDLTVFVENVDLAIYDEPLKPMSSIVSDLPYMLTEFKFHDKEENVQILLELYTQFDNFLAQIIELEKERSAKGLFMQPSALYEIISQCREFIDQGENHYLITSFDEKIDAFSSLDNAKKEQYKKQCRDNVETLILPEYEKFIVELDKLRGTHKGTGRLSDLPEGKRYFEYLMKTTTGSSRFVEKIKEMAIAEHDRMSLRTAELIEQDPNVIDQFYQVKSPDLDPLESFETIEQQMKQHFPEIVKPEISIKPYPKAYQSSGSLAMYFYPPIDDNSANLIYLNESLLNPKDINTFVTLGHEGLPGHMYQVNYFYQTDPMLIRHMFSFTGYSEGWTRYTEQYSIDYANIGSDNLTEFTQIQNSIFNYIYLICEIGIHYEGWNEEVVTKLIADLGYGSEVGKTLYSTLLNNPGVYIPYSVGFLEMVTMRQEAEEALKDKFDAVEFHKTILEVGPAPYDIIRKEFDKYLKASSENSLNNSAESSDNAGNIAA